MEASRSTMMHLMTGKCNNSGFIDFEDSTVDDNEEIPESYGMPYVKFSMVQKGTFTLYHCQNGTCMRPLLEQVGDSDAQNGFWGSCNGMNDRDHAKTLGDYYLRFPEV